jgi:hypothetical protein
MKNWQKGVLFLFGLFFLTGIYFFCEHQTQGFRYYQLVSNIPNDIRWQTPSLTIEERQTVDRLLDQTFTYLGKGAFCYAFLGQDQKTVLKFYSHDHLNLSALFHNFSWEKLLLKSSLAAGFTPHQEFCFKSCKLLYSKAREKTGLIYIHLNKTHDLRKQITLIDNIGVRHTIDVNATEFVLQQRAESLIQYIDRSVQENKNQNALCAIDNYFNLLLSISKLGIRDLDRSFRNNFGILENGSVITIDISSFSEDKSLQRPAVYKKEIILKSQNLAKWLKRHHPDLFNYYDEKLTSLIEND